MKVTVSPCQAPCRQGRACQGFHNIASPDDYLDNEDDIGNDLDNDDCDGNGFCLKTSFMK